MVTDDLAFLFTSKQMKNNQKQHCLSCQNSSFYKCLCFGGTYSQEFLPAAVSKLIRIWQKYSSSCIGL